MEDYALDTTLHEEMCDVLESVHVKSLLEKIQPRLFCNPRLRQSPLARGGAPSVDEKKAIQAAIRETMDIVLGSTEDEKSDMSPAEWFDVATDLRQRMFDKLTAVVPEPTGPDPAAWPEGASRSSRKRRVIVEE